MPVASHAAPSLPCFSLASPPPLPLFDATPSSSFRAAPFPSGFRGDGGAGALTLAARPGTRKAGSRFALQAPHGTEPPGPSLAEQLPAAAVDGSLP
ncbi:hypothetical protein MTO96_048347 [Rhipicephalus appendiculatus]